MIDLRVLGPISVSGSSGDLEIGGPRQRRLLAALVVNANSVVPTSQLMDVLWEGRPPDGARRSFKSYVGRLRAALAADDAADLIVTHPAGYALDVDPDHIDSSRFERLVERARAELALGESAAAADLVDEALALWRGQPCHEFIGEEWVEPFTARLESTYASALELRIEVMLATGHHGDALPEIDHLVERFPYRDGLRRLRMLALYRAGRHVDALREYQQYRTMLAEEVGIEPGDDLVRLEQQILARDDELLAPAQGRRRIGDYELGERVGVDDTAVVYRARQTSVGREVAVKAIRPELANDADFIRRFEAEAQLLAAVEHPNVVPLYDFWREPGSAYLVTRWLGGGSLRDRLATGPFPLDAVVSLTDDIAGALAAVRSAGIAHIDLASSGILFDDLGRAHLTKLGIAALDRATEPEDGADAATPSRRGLVASIGRLLHEVMTGAPPTRASESWEATPLRHDIPAGLDAAVRTACSTDPADRFADPAELAVAVRSALIGLPHPDRRSADPSGQSTDTVRGANPYKGLRAFGEGDSRDFFGREHLIDRLMAAVAESRFVAVVGPSGSGKSSTVRAGVIPRLRAVGERSPTAGRPFVTTMVPGSNPFAELERALTRVSARSPSAPASSAAGLARCLQEILPGDSGLILVVDQFEELFTSVDRDQRDAFLGAVRELVDDPSARLRVVITIRADFYDRPLQHPTVGPLVRDHSVAVTPLEAAELEAAITRPARRLGVDFEPPLVAELVADAARNPNTLPMLQFALTELFERRRDHVIRAAEYEAMGGLSGIIASRADALYTDLPADQHDGVRRLFGQLVVVGDGPEETRRRARVDELPNVPDAIVDVYARARLLTIDRDPVSRVPTVEVAHEALIRNWPRLREWLDEDRDALRTLRHLNAAAHSWDERGRDADELYRGARLAGALELKTHRDELVTDVAEEFVAASTEASVADVRRARRTTRRLRGLLAATAVGLVLALVAGAVAISRSRTAAERSREAELTTVIAAANEAVEAEPQLAALLALEANRLSDDPRAREILQSAVTADLGRLATWTPTSGPVMEAALSGDGSRLAVTSGTSIEVLDLETLQPVGAPHERLYDPSLETGGQRLTISHHGRTLGVVTRSEVQRDGGRGQEESMTFVDTDTGERSAGPPIGFVPGVGTDAGDPIQFLRADFNPAMPLLVTASHINRDIGTTVYRGTDPTEVSDLPGIALGFSGDGSRMMSVEGPFSETVTIRDAANMREVASVATIDLGFGPAEAVSAALDHSGSRLLVFTATGLSVFDIDESGTISPDPVQITTSSWPAGAATSRDGRVALVDEDGLVRVHDLDDGSLLGRPIAPRPGPRGVAVAFRPDGTLVTVGREVTIRSSDGSTAVGGAAGRGDYGLRLSPDGETLATTNHFGELFLYETATGKLRATVEVGRNGERVAGTPLAFSPDGSTLIAAGGAGSDHPSGSPGAGYSTALLNVIDAVTGDIVASHTTRTGTLDPTAVAVSPDGEHVLIGRREGGVELRTFPDLHEVVVGGDDRVHRHHLSFDNLGGSQRVMSVAFSPDEGSYLALHDEGTLISWSRASGQEQWRSDVASGALVALDDGRFLMSADDGTVTVRNADGDVVGPAFSGHLGPVTAIDVAGDLVATSGEDDTVRLWNLSTGQPIGQPIDVTGGAVDLSDDGRHLAVVSPNGHATVLVMEPDGWADAACRLAGRNLTTQEWDRYLPPSEPYRATCPQWPAAAG